MSSALLSILLLAMGSAILIAVKALPDPVRPTWKLIREGEIANQIITELQEAVHITERTAHAITFTVADRDADGSPECIRYAWSETAGDPLTRQYNHGSVVNVLADLHEFDLTYDIQAVTEEYPGAPIESTESILTQYTAAGDSDYTINTTNWIGQYLHPDDFLPAEAIAWKITKVGFLAKIMPPNGGETKVQLRPATGDNKPDTKVLAEKIMLEGNLVATYTWAEFAFADSAVSDLSPSQGLCLVLQFYKNADSASINYVKKAGRGRVNTANAGTSWTYQDASSMCYKIWGTYKTPGPTQTATRQYVTGIHMSLQIGDDSAARIDTAVRTPNTPEVLSAVWELDFDGDPRTVDTNADGMGDWDEYSTSFNPATLVNGIWYAPNQVLGGVSSIPNEDFAELTTVELRCRATSVGGSGAIFWINADRHDGKSANLIAGLYKPDAASQELWIGQELPDGTKQWLAIYDVPDDFVNVRLLIDPAEGTFAVFADGTHKNTYAYSWGNDDPAAKAWVYTEGCSAEFDYVSIRVGGNNP